MPKVIDLKKLSSVLCAAVLVAAVLAMPAQAFAASKLRVSTSAKAVAKSGSTGKVLIAAKTSKAAKYKVTVYKDGKRIRTIKPKGTWFRKTSTWNLRDNNGDKVAAGVYKVKVTATRRGKTVSKTTRVRVVRKKTTPAPVQPAPAPAPQPAPAPTPAPEPTPDPSTPTAPVVPVVNPTQGPRWVGFYVPGAPASMSPINQVESVTGADSAVINFFISDGESFPAPRCNSVRNADAVPLVTLEFWSTQNGGLDSITNGNKDAYLRTFADAAKAYGGEVWLRPFHEMNGNWYPWSGTATGNSSEDLIAAWRHVHDIFESRGATNVKFVWCVNNDSVPNTSANQIAKYWPGDAYVDMAALDGYNWGTSTSWSSWSSFGSVFGASYNTVAGLTSKPMFVAETGCSEQGGSKAAWLTDMFSSINRTYTRIQGVVWFEANKECDWRVTATSASTAAFKTAVATGY